MFKSNFVLLSSFHFEFERVINGLEDQSQSKHGVRESSVKTTGIFLSGA